jgi:hypothetical protein
MLHEEVGAHRQLEERITQRLEHFVVVGCGVSCRVVRVCVRACVRVCVCVCVSCTK